MASHRECFLLLLGPFLLALSCRVLSNPKHKVRSVSQLQLENVSSTKPTCNHIVILELFAKNQPLDRVVVCEQRHEVLQDESLAVS